MIDELQDDSWIHIFLNSNFNYRKVGNMRENNIDLKAIATYNSIFESEIYSHEQIIRRIRCLDQRSCLVCIGYLLNNFEIGTEIKANFLARSYYKDSINDRFQEYELYSKQGLLYLAKWIIAYGIETCEEDYVIINEGLIDKVIIIQMMTADYLPSSNIKSIESYLFKNVAINYRRNIKNDLARAYRMFTVLSQQRELYCENEYINFYEDYKIKYGQSINDYLALFFPMIRLHFSDRANECPILNIEKFSKKMKKQNEFFKLVKGKSHSIPELIAWCEGTIDNTWDYSQFFIKPFIYLGDGWVLSLHEDFVINQCFEGLFYRIREVYQDESTEIISFLGRPFEKYVSELTSRAVLEAEGKGYEFIQEFKYGRTNKDSSDAYIRSGKKLLIIEAKSKRPNFEIYYTDDQKKMMQGIDKIYISPINQAIAAYAAILRSEEGIIFDGVEEIYVLSVTLLNVPRVSIIQKYVDSSISSELGEKLRGHINLNIEEFEYLCGITKDDIELFAFLKEFCDRRNLSPLVNFLATKKIDNYHLRWIDNIFMKFAGEVHSTLFES